VSRSHWLLLTAAAVLGAEHRAAAQPTPSIEELWQIVQRQQSEIQDLRQQLAATTERVSDAGQQLQATRQQVEATGQFVERLGPAAEPRTNIGAYGELHYNNIDADDGTNDVDAIDYHRFVLFFGHRFNERTRFFSELEIEHSLAGDGAPGEVELEQAYVDFALSGDKSARAGLFLLPVGILNETHEPPTFYGVERNDVESIIIPSTWWEAGAGLSGQYASGLSWDLAMHSGLAMPTTGGSAFRVRSGRQKVAEALASDAAYSFRLRYRGLPGLELSGTYQYQADPSQVPGDGLDSGQLFSAHAIYQAGDFTLRALYADWSFDGVAVEAAGADEQSGWYLEPSYRLSDRWGIYGRYEDLQAARAIDRFSQWEAGLNYWPVPNVVVKFDYRSRDHDLSTLAGEDFDAIDIGLGYQF
jgi:uncharacterized coiled-coil protein SlyX